MINFVNICIAFIVINVALWIAADLIVREVSAIQDLLNVDRSKYKYEIRSLIRPKCYFVIGKKKSL